MSRRVIVRSSLLVSLILGLMCGMLPAGGQYPGGPGDLNADLNGDEVINMADLAIMAQQWGREYEMPFTDDE